MGSKKLFPVLIIILLVTVTAVTGCGGGGSGATAAPAVADGSGSGGGNATGATGVVELSWNAPTTNTDGTPLTDLAGYKIHYGTEPGAYTAAFAIGKVTTYTFALPAGTYYFAVTSHDTLGSESALSNEVAKTVL